MKYLTILLVCFPLFLNAQKKRYNPKEKHERGYRIATIKFRPPNWIDRRITNKAIYYGWSTGRERLERNKHPDGGYLTVKIKNYDDLTSPTDTFEVRVYDPEGDLVEKHNIYPGWESMKPTRYLWEYFSRNRKIIVPLRIQTPHNVKRIAIVNTRTRTVQEFVIICTRGKTRYL